MATSTNKCLLVAAKWLVSVSFVPGAMAEMAAGALVNGIWQMSSLGDSIVFQFLLRLSALS
jgi:hypothetical protein